MEQKLSPQPLIQSIGDLDPFLSGSPGEGVQAALCLIRELTGTPEVGLVLLRQNRIVAQVWAGNESIAREGMRRAASTVSEVMDGSMVIRGADECDKFLFRLTSLTCEGGLYALLVADFPEGITPDASGFEASDALAALVARQWVVHERLLEVERDKKQKERWFKTMDDQIQVLDRERQKFVAVVNQSDTFMFVANPGMMVDWVNASMARHVDGDGDRRITPGMTVDRAWAALGITAPPSGSDACPVMRTFATKRVFHDEMRRKGDANGVFYVTFLPIKGPDGRTAETLVMVQDLSGLEVMRRMEARYRRLFEESPDGMIMIDPQEDAILLANDAAAALTGYDREALKGVSVKSLHAPEDWERASEAYELALTQSHNLSGEWRLVSCDGRLIDVTVTVTRFELDGRITALAQFRDETEKRQLELELLHAQKMDAIGCLAGGVAHDFNNLLTVILGQSELLLHHLGDRNDRTADIVDVIRTSAVRGSMLTRQLLAFSRKDVVRTQTLDVRQVTTDIVTMLENLLGERVRLTTDLVEESCAISIDRGRLEQVLVNLAVNARDAMPSGGGLGIRVYIEPPMSRSGGSPSWDLAPPAGERVILEVADEGVGMEEQTRKRLFEPFFTTKKVGEGTGLGLSTVYGIVKDAAGGIEVLSTPGEGTTFRIHFPRVAAAEDLPTETATSGIVPGTERILLVEDEDELRLMAAEALEIAGYTVTTACSGEAAMDIYEETKVLFDLLVTDVVMPGISGGELAQRIRAEHPDTPVLYMSGYADDAIVHHGVSSKDASFLPKPYTLQTLTAKVREVLDAPPASPRESGRI